MSDSGSHTKPRRHRSLLALGKARERASQTGSRQGSLLSGADTEKFPDAAELLAQHRLSRSRREARRNEYLATLARNIPDPVSDDDGGDTQAMPENGTDFRSNLNRGDESGHRNQHTGRLDYRNRDRDDDIWQPMIDPVDVVSGIWRSRTIIVFATLAGLVFGALYALSTPKYYYSTAEILLDPRELKLSNTDIKQSDLPYSATLALIENQVRIITSSTVVNGVVERLNLQRDPEFNGELGGGFGELLKIVGALLGRDVSDASGSNFATAIDNVYDKLSVERSGKTFIVTINFGSREPDKAALIANTFTQVYLETYKTLTSDTAIRANTEVTARLSELRKGVEEAEKAVERYKSENGIIDARGHLITDDELLRINDSLSAAKARTIELGVKAANIRELDIDSLVDGGLPEQLVSQTLVALRSQYAAAKQEVDQLAVNLGARHPRLREAQARLESSRSAINSELRRIVSATQVDLKRAVKQEQQLASRLAQLKTRQGSLSDDMIELRELERDAASKRSIYENYLLRAREIGEQAGLNTSNFSVISDAQPALKPTGPRRAFIAAMGGFLGFILGVVFGGLRGAWAGYSGRLNYSPRPPESRASKTGFERSRGRGTANDEHKSGTGVQLRSAPAGHDRETSADPAPAMPVSGDPSHTPQPQQPPAHASPVGAAPVYQQPVAQPYPHYVPWMPPVSSPMMFAPAPVQMAQPVYFPAGQTAGDPGQAAQGPPDKQQQASLVAEEQVPTQSARRSRTDAGGPSRARTEAGPEIAPGDIAEIRQRLRNFRNKVDSLSSARRR